MSRMAADAGSKGSARYDVLAFGAHPDDIEMSMAGTVARLVRSGRSVLMISLTPGDASTHGTIEDRAAEARAGAAVLGADVLLLDFHDTRVENTNDGRLALARLVRTHQPSLVFAPYHTNPGTHHDGRANRDHMATGELVRDALKLARFRSLLPELPPHDVRRALYYMVPNGVVPHLVVNVSDEEETITRSIQAHATQMSIRRRGEAIQEILVLYRRMAGVLIGARLGETFLTDEPLEAGPDELMRL
jgi:LmbE family N-acetylglucosaminyl deacetylase